MGSAIDLDTDGTRVGATIGLNVQDVTNQASIGAGAHVTGQAGITVEATVPVPDADDDPFNAGTPSYNDFIVWSFAAAGGKSTSVAGSAAVQILLLTTEAWVGAGAELDAPAGGITIDAQPAHALQNLAIAGALSTEPGPPSAAAFPVNWLEWRPRHGSTPPPWTRNDTSTPAVPRGDGTTTPQPARPRPARAAQGQGGLAETQQRGHRRRRELRRRGRHRRLRGGDHQPGHPGVDRRRCARQPGRRRRRRRTEHHRRGPRTTSGSWTSAAHSP